MTTLAQKRTLGKRIRESWPAALAALVGLIVMIPMLLKPYAPYAYDSLHHLFTLFSLDQRIAAGDVYPLRFPGFAYGYGWAELSYYPLLPPYLLELLHLLGANYVIAYKLGLTLIVVGAALTSYALGASLFNRYAGLVAAVAYVLNPYFLSDIYPRGAVAEALGLAVAPLVFLAILRATRAPGWRTYLDLSLAVAVIILTHPLSTFLFVPFILAFAVVALAWTGKAQRGHAFGVLAAGALTGALLSCFYWLPAMLERGGLRVFDQSVVHATFLNDLKPLHQMLQFGWLGGSSSEYPAVTFPIALVLLFALSLVGWGMARRRNRGPKSTWILFFIACFLVDIWMMSSYATPLWRAFPQVVYVQFPFRWLGPLALLLALIIGGGIELLSTVRSGRFIWGGTAILLVALAVTALAPQKVNPAMLASAGIAKATSEDISQSGLLAYEHDVATRLVNEGCWIWAYEYIPSTSIYSDCSTFVDTVLSDVPLRSKLPPVQASVDPSAVDANHLEAQVSSPEPWQLSLHAFWIPGWTATIDGKPAPTEPTDEIGVVGVALPAGEHQVRLAFGPTPLRSALVVVSLLALAAWLVMAWWRHRRLAAIVSALLLLIVVLVGGRALHAPAAPALQPLDVNLGDKIGLQGFAISRQGYKVDVNLVWLARASMEESYKVFIHVLDAQGKPLAQTDSRPLNYADNTNRWIPGQVIYDHYEVPLPPDAPPGSYEVRVGMYNEADGQRLPVLDAAGQQVDDQVLLGYVDLP